MKRNWGILCLTSTIGLVVLTSCLITTLDTVWKDPQFMGGKLNKILVIGIAKNQTLRRVFEDEFVSKIETYGTDAVSSYRVMPTEEMLKKSTVESIIKTSDFDAVIVTRLVNKKVEKVYDPYRYHYNDWYGYYSRGYSYATASRSYTEYEVLNIETIVYDTKTNKMIWSALSDTITGGSKEAEIKSLIRVITKGLSDSQLI